MPYNLRKPGGDEVWLADINKVYVQVSEGHHGDEWEEQRTTHLAQTTSKEHLAQIGRTTVKPEKCHDTDGIPFTDSTQPAVPGCYTYVCLILGGLWIMCKDGWYCTYNTRYHVTLGYLPGMVANKWWSLQRDLCNACDVWKRLRRVPLERPLSTDLLWVRHCKFYPVKEVCSQVDALVGVKDEIGPYCGAMICPIVDFAIEDLLKLVSEDNIAFTTPAGSDMTLTEALLKYHDRDTKRRAEATDRAKQLIPLQESNDKPIQVPLSGCHVRQEGELHDLLEYLLARLSFKHSVWHMHPKGEVGLHHAMSWHVSIEDGPEIVPLRPPWL